MTKEYLAFENNDNNNKKNLAFEHSEFYSLR